MPISFSSREEVLGQQERIGAVHPGDHGGVAVTTGSTSWAISSTISLALP